MTESVFILAKMAANIYELEHSADEGKLNKDLENYKIIPSSIERGGMGCACMGVYQCTTNSNVVLAIKGTSTTNATDILNDISLVLSGTIFNLLAGAAVGLTAAFLPAITIQKALYLKKTYGVNLITGHSLGGYMAEILATQYNIRGIGFNAPGTNGPTTKLGGAVVEGFHNVNAESDKIGNFNIVFVHHVQWSIYVPSSGSLLEKHSMANMVDYFAKYPDITNANIQARSKSYRTGYYYPK